jgi:RNA recognition motif-containing protein
MDSNNKLIKCRKCGANHLTIKCGKNKNTENMVYKKIYNDKTYKIKILNLPSDFKYSEISEFAKDWGHIIKINTKNFDNNSMAIIEFKYECEAEYFIRALDNTPFEHHILNVLKIDE